jgi:hypothetical protein
MRKLDWFLAAIVASFLLAVLAIETTSVSVGAVSFGMAPTGHVTEVAMRRVVNCLRHPAMLSLGPR